MGTWNEDVQNSLLAISLTSGHAAVYSQISSNVFRVGTSAAQFPNVSGAYHIVRLAQSGIIYIAGTSGAVSSGVGFWVGGSPSDTSASLDLNIGNLNLIWGIAVTSSIVTHISFS